MTTQAQVNSFARNPINFMKTNIVRYVGSKYPHPILIKKFAMKLCGGDPGRRQVLGGIKANTQKHDILNYDEIAQAEGWVSFDAVWSGYVKGGGQTVQLPANGGPDIMLTPQLTGCAIVSKVNADGSASFSHYNHSADGQTLGATDMAATALNEHGGQSELVTKETYRSLGKGVDELQVSVTVVGFRRNSIWEFWGQVLEYKASGMQMRQVRKLG